MEKDTNSFNDYQYKSKNVDFSWRIKLRSTIRAFLGRRDALKVFCQKNKIKYPVDNNILHTLPEKYLIENDEILYIAKIRDKIIIGFHEDYAKKQQLIDIELDRQKAIIENDSRVLKNEQKKLDSHKKKKQTSKDAQETIWLQSEIATTEAAISNIETRINSVESTIESYKNVKKENIESWKKQIDAVLAIEKIHNEEFVSSLTKKITKKLGFKEFKYRIIEPNESVKRIKNGEYDVR